MDNCCQPWIYDYYYDCKACFSPYVPATRTRFTDASGRVYHGCWDQTCHADCQTCDYKGSTDCLTCYPNGAKPYFNNYACYASCGNQMYVADAVNKICGSCDGSCLTCSGSASTNCLTCDKAGSHPWFYSTDHTCSGSCPAGTYASDNTNKLCSKCNADCQTCSGSLSTNCLSCVLTSSKPYYYTNICYATCPSNTYISNVATKVCSLCNADCLTCSGGTATDCLSCHSPSSKPWYYTDYKTCLASCPTGSYQSDVTNKHCSKCHSDCDTCSGAGDHDCLTCNLAAVKIWYYSVDKTCTATCPDGSYSSDNTNKYCSTCNADCKTCTGSANNLCLSCYPAGAKPYFYNADGTCWASCPSGTYVSNVANKYCSICHSDCKTCSGGGDHDCLTCDLTASKMWYYNIDKICVASCPSGTYISDNTLKLCSQCHSSCETCSGALATNCLTCNLAGSTMWYFSDANTCTNPCPDGSYASDSTNKYCSACHSDCKSCTAPGEHNCLSCYLTAVKKWYYDPDNSCYDACPMSTYASDTTNKICSRCHSDCQSCSGPTEHDCESCDPCAAKEWYFAADKTCYEQCPVIGSFPADYTNKICGQCHSSCKTCFGFGNHGCYTCDSLGSTKWYYSVESSCTSVCPFGSYPADYISFFCNTCHKKCADCRKYRICTACPNS